MATISERRSDEPGNLTAAGLLVPATIFVAIGLHGADRDPVPLQPEPAFVPGQLMVDALTFDNYVKFFTDPFYLQVLWTHDPRGGGLHRLLPDLRLPLGLCAGPHPDALQEPPGHGDRAAALRRQRRARRGLDGGLRQQGLRQRDADGIWASSPSRFEIMYTELAVIIGIIAVNLPYMVLTLQSVIEGIDRNVEEAAFSLGAPPMTMATRVLLPLALPGILAGVDPHLHPGDERLCDAGAARRTEVQDDGTAGLRASSPSSTTGPSAPRSPSS
jgi:putative spermidine/putrescine transport system permease protein